MHKYRVIEPHAQERLLTLRCSRGHYHVARALSVLPKAGATLGGDKPHLGFGILLCAESGAVYRVIFESIGMIGMIGLIGTTEPPFAPNAAPGARHRPQGANRDAPWGAA